MWLHAVLLCSVGSAGLKNCRTLLVSGNDTTPQITTLLTNNRERQSPGIKRAVSAIKAPGPNGPIDVSLVDSTSYLQLPISRFQVLPVQQEIWIDQHSTSWQNLFSFPKKYATFVLHQFVTNCDMIQAIFLDVWICLKNIS